MKNNDTQSTVNQEDTPPILGTWKRLYITILIAHAVIISLFYLFTKTFS